MTPSKTVNRPCPGTPGSESTIPSATIPKFGLAGFAEVILGKFDENERDDGQVDGEGGEEDQNADQDTLPRDR
jgi:hypothetical protein